MFRCLPGLCLALGLMTAGSLVGAEEALSRDQREGQQLAAELRALRPVESFTNSATLKVRDAEGNVRRLPLTIMNQLGAAEDWRVIYAAGGPTNETLVMIRHPDRPPEYTVIEGSLAGRAVAPEGAARPFAGSDFSLRELGLEFLHWPGQRILPKSPPPMKKGQPCKILESVNPAAPDYTRVVSWVSIEHRGLLLADAYDANGRLVKRFSIGSLKKNPDGVWQLRDMEMIDEVRGTETKLEFELKARE